MNIVEKYDYPSLKRDDSNKTRLYKTPDGDFPSVTTILDKTKDKTFPKRTSKLPKVKTRDGAYDPIKEGGIGTDEDPDTQGPVKPVSRTGPATDEKKFAANERINDLEDKIEYLTNDIDELSGDQSRKATAKIKELIAKRKAHKQKLKILRKS